jgi:hypothetical protein
MVAPKWVSTRCQPIATYDVIRYLVAAADRPESESTIYEIGGEDVLTYREMMMRYAATRGLSRYMLVVPLLTPRLSSYWIHLVTPIPASIARPLVEGLTNEVIVKNDAARRAFPDIVPMGYAQALRLALDRSLPTEPATTWFDAYDVRTLPGEFTGLTQGMLIDRRERQTRATPAQVSAVYSSLGGKRGWLTGDFLWQLRGTMDRLVGGIGTRRGRRSATELRVGDAVDFWRVEQYRPPALLRFRAEMKLPGIAWLQFESTPNDAGGTTLRQTAFFEPRGLLGYVYWYMVLPFHEFVFGNMARRIVEEAEALDKRAGVSQPRKDAA